MFRVDESTLYMIIIVDYLVIVLTQEKVTLVIISITWYYYVLDGICIYKLQIRNSPNIRSCSYLC